MRFRSVTISLLLMALVGCSTATVKQPMVTAVAGDPDPLSAELDFWHGLTSRPVICNDDAFHGLLLFLDDNDPNADYAHRMAALKSRKLIPADFNAPGNEAVHRGVVAYALLQALHIQGGWVLTMLGPTERYAVRELMYRNLFPRSSPEQTFTGSEFVGIIGRAEDYHEGASGFIPAATLQPQTPGN